MTAETPTPPTLAERLAAAAERRRLIQEQIEAEARRRDAFAVATVARRIKWSGHNLARLLRSTGERPERVEAMRAILGRLGLGGDRRWPGPGGVFDHGEMWGRSGQPWAIVGHPYGLGDEQRADLAELGRRFPSLRVSIDDRPSYYGFGTHHVRVEVPEPRRPFARPPATRATRAAARAFRVALGGTS